MNGNAVLAGLGQGLQTFGLLKQAQIQDTAAQRKEERQFNLDKEKLDIMRAQAKQAHEDAQARNKLLEKQAGAPKYEVIYDTVMEKDPITGKEVQTKRAVGRVLISGEGERHPEYFGDYKPKTPAAGGGGGDDKKVPPPPAAVDTTQPEQGPGLIDRVRGMFGGGEETPPPGETPAPVDTSTPRRTRRSQAAPGGAGEPSFEEKVAQLGLPDFETWKQQQSQETAGRRRGGAPTIQDYQTYVNAQYLLSQAKQGIAPGRSSAGFGGR